MSASRQFSLFFALILASALIPGVAFAQQSTIATSLCDVVNMITGPAGKAIASLAVIVVGISSLLGRVQWNQAIIVCAGIAVIFGAPSLLSEMTGQNVQDCHVISPNTPPAMIDGPVATTLCNVVAFFSGLVGQALATIGIIIMGIMALMGKLAPPYALMVSVGIAIIFGSAEIVRDLSPPGTYDDTYSAESTCEPLFGG